MTEIKVPQENVNDENVVILEIFFGSGSKVKSGDVLVEIETTKVSLEIEAPCDGILNHNLSKGDILPVGSLLCTIFENIEINKVYSKDSSIEKNSKTTSKAFISNAAKKKALELKIDLSSISSGFVTVSDIEKMSLKKKAFKNIDNLEIFPNSVFIFGGGGHSKMCIDLVKQTKNYHILGIVDDKLEIGSDVLGVKVIGNTNLINQLSEIGVKYAINGVGSISKPKIRVEIHNKLNDLGFLLPNLIHPSSNIEPSVKMGDGNQIMMGAVVGSDVQIGDGCIVNSKAVISHDCILRDHCHVCPGAILAGSIDVGEISVIGMGATIYIGCKIGNKSIIFNGMNITKDVAENEIVDGK